MTLNVAGSEKYRSITTGHYRYALGAVLMYDIQNADTFKNCRYWLENIKTFADENVVIALVGKTINLICKNCVSHLSLIFRQQGRHL